MADPKRDWKWTFRDSRQFTDFSSSPRSRSQNDLDDHSGPRTDDRCLRELRSFGTGYEEALRFSHMPPCDCLVTGVTRYRRSDSTNDVRPLARRSDLTNVETYKRVAFRCPSSDSDYHTNGPCSVFNKNLFSRPQVSLIRTRRGDVSRLHSVTSLPPIYNDRFRTFPRRRSDCDNTFLRPVGGPVGGRPVRLGPIDSSTDFEKSFKHVPIIHILNAFLSFLFNLGKILFDYSNSPRKLFPKYSFLIFVLILFSLQSTASANRPPRFLINGQTEIVIRLKEGSETPIGNFFFVIFPLK